ncbi:hypothetical protein [Aureispira anguillae]|uniref:Uncharacterized protein n=1 Tax=Aureispira anguillae TaxID=2864201 RepID=A0A916DSS6_9BACT|nr:hypothetical protein [Aureispira anguillae]BDS11006.1 hypothetical protein AsAng_0017160 [Aureispira anguillae]
MVLGLFLCCGKTAQTQVDFELMEQQMIDNYQILKEAYENGNPERQQIFGKKLKRQIMFALLQKGSYYYPFFRLRRYIQMVESQDKKIRIFSWDGMVGGNWRKMYSIAQFRGVQNQSYFKILSDGEQIVHRYQDVCIHAIHQVPAPQNNGSYYVVIGKGSHAKGQQHTTVRVFYFSHNELLECSDCFEQGETYWTINSSIYYPIDLTYDSKRKQIRYLKPTYDPKTGNRQRGRYHRLYWREGKFSADGN